MTRQERARKMLIGMGVKSAADFTPFSLGPTIANRDRNRKIVDAVIFNGWTLKEAGDTFGVSHEQARIIALGSVRRLAGRHEDVSPKEPKA